MEIDKILKENVMLKIEMKKLKTCNETLRGCIVDLFKNILDEHDKTGSCEIEISEKDVETMKSIISNLEVKNDK